MGTAMPRNRPLARWRFHASHAPVNGALSRAWAVAIRGWLSPQMAIHAVGCGHATRRNGAHLESREDAFWRTAPAAPGFTARRDGSSDRHRPGRRVGCSQERRHEPHPRSGLAAVPGGPANLGQAMVRPRRSHTFQQPAQAQCCGSTRPFSASRLALIQDMERIWKRPPFADRAGLAGGGSARALGAPISTVLENGWDRRDAPRRIRDMARLRPRCDSMATQGGGVHARARDGRAVCQRGACTPTVRLVYIPLPCYVALCLSVHTNGIH